MLFNKLHNLCINFGMNIIGEGSNGVITVMPEDFDENDTAFAWFNEYNSENGGELPSNRHSCSLRRNKIAVWLKEQGYVRPARSMRNSRA